MENSDFDDLKSVYNLNSPKTKEDTPQNNIQERERYKIIGQIGSGGMGKVYKAFDNELKRVIAIKVMLGESNPQQIERFFREAKAMAELNHPNIIRFYDIGQIKGQNYFSMEFIEGASLREVIKEKKRLVCKHAAEIMLKITQAIDYAHQQGIIHRDLKPENIMFRKDKDPVIMDFGIAKFMSSTGLKLTKTGVSLGTLTYMSPEQADGINRLIDEKTDIYALGAILYEMLAGHPPFTSTSQTELLLKIFEETPPRLNAKWRIPKALEAICFKALSKDKKDRYSTVMEMNKDINRYLQGEPVLAQTPNYLTYSMAWFKKNSKLLVANTIIVFILTLLGYYFIQETKQSKNSIDIKVSPKPDENSSDDAKKQNPPKTPNENLLNATQKEKTIKDKITIDSAKYNIDLLDGAKEGNIAKVKNSLAANANPNAKTNGGFTALILASLQGYVEIVKVLLDVKVDINSMNNDGLSALMAASQEGYIEIVKMLIDADANPNAKANNGFTALMLAAWGGYVEIVKMLIDANANPNAININGETALFLSLMKGNNIEVVKILLNAKIDPNISNNNGGTALIGASEKGYTEIVKILLAANANPNAANNTGETALIFASFKGHKDIVKVLLDAKANPNATQNGNVTALMLASQQGYVEVVKMLIDANANVDTKANNGLTALMVAKQRGHTEVANLLVEASDKKK